MVKYIMSTPSTLLDLPLYAALDVGDTKMVQQLLAHGMRVDDFQDVVGHQIAVGSMQKGRQISSYRGCELCRHVISYVHAKNS